ncbi:MULTISPECIES: alpha/beta fold hydrolase [unclassified Knoellia]|uniref:alpha/beta fold hydrolase n=1 Tax=Knoellia altitudinis TaxID=3404795 RepID=UPI00361B400C
MPEPTALLALPGLGLGPESWRPTLKHLPGAGAPVRLLPGFGEPAHRRQDLDPRALAENVLAVLPDDVTRVVLLAHSASSQVAAHVAALAPARVVALVLVGPTTDPRTTTWPRLVARWVATAPLETPRQVPTLLRQYARTTLPAMVRGLDAVRKDSIEQTLDRVKAPVLVVRGPRDHICLEDWAASVAAHGGEGSRHVTLSAGAHMVPFTHGRLVADVVREFLCELDASTSASSA